MHRLIRYIEDRKRFRERWVCALKEASCPIGLINGSLDPVSGEHMVQRFEELVGTDRFVRRLPRVGHYPQVEAPEAVVDAYSDFLGSVASSSS